MAVIILKGADFSANNIGKIVIPEEALNPFTLKIFSHCTRFDILSPQAVLVDNFIKYLDNEGLLEHLGLFIAPWLSSNIGEATYNLAKDQQLQYDEGVAFSDGILSSTVIAKTVKIGNNIVPVVNFMGTIGSSVLIDWSCAFKSTGASQMTVICRWKEDRTTISKALNQTDASGYRMNTQSWTNVGYRLWNIKGLSDLDTNGTTVNGISVTPNTGYTKENEPLVSSYGIVELIPDASSSKVTGGETKQIIFAGDGTTLTDTQVTSMLNAIQTLQAGLAELEN